ncbi:alsin-like protein [Leptotrombidium deliense]|uniref:Alsin-like protein n=1 Tax=Leptotrombidium deliense TaxID=299467 RepID=A0A443SJ51_9ACAR|nr:alsin-like protein [Leptotrombidium deliense]
MCLSPNIVQSIAAEIYGVKTTKKKSAQELLYILLSIPTKRINEYISFMERYSMKSNTENGSNFIPQCVLNDWKLIKDYSASELKKAQQTRDFWNSSSKKLVDFYCIPSRRLVKDHKSEPLSLISTTLPTSSSLLTSPSFTLFNDVFVYYSGQFVTIPLETIWIDSNDETLPDCYFRLILPEDKITFSTSSPESRTVWISTFNHSIKSALERQKLCDIILVMKKSCRQELGSSMFPPASRNAFYQFKRHSVYKDATYYGGWLNAKLHGEGEIMWSDGRIFNGKFQDNVQNGEGVYKIVESEGDTVYKGMWVNGLMKGFGYIKYWNGDTYRGYFANNERNGFGILKCGCFLSDAASVYVGEWQNNKRHGYGVLDDIMSREIYLGSWKDDVRHGNGVVVNIDGIYYEGSFVNDVLTGPGLLIYDDGTVFDGELGPGGLLKGKGVMKFPNGDVIEGIFDGFWREDVKINGVLRKMSPHTDTIDSNKHCDRLSKIGVHAIAAKEKWKCVFDECKQLLKFDSGNNNAAWETIAVSVHKKRTEISRRTSKRFTMDPSFLNSLERIPRNAQKSDKELTVDDYYRIKEYLLTACSCEFHPLGTLISTLLDVYRTSYLGKGANVRLLPHAVSEIKSFLERVYEIVRFLFPDLPAFNSPLTIELNEDATTGSRLGRQSSLIIGDLISNEDGQHCLTVTPSTLLHPILLPPLHPALFTLYGLKCEKEDIQYWDRLLRWNKQSDIALMSFLGVDENLYLLRSDGDTSPLLRPSTQRVHRLQKPSETLQRIRTATTPVEKLLVVKETIDEIKSEFPEDFMWGMDHLFPVFLFVVIRAKIKNLGADIHFIQDLMDSHFENGELGYMFTTLKASYYQIITEKLYNL